MAEILGGTTILNGGMTSDPRNPNPSFAQVIKHFDIFTKRQALIPYRSTKDFDSSSSTNQIARMLFANNKIYGLSIASGSSQKLFSRELADLTDATWDSPANVSVAGAPNGFMFCDYPRTGKLYWSLNAAIASYHYSDATYAASASAIVATANALVHSKDDIMYVPLANIIATNNNDSWNTAALTLPAEYTISSLFEYGNYLGIACKPVNGFGRSKVFLWDRDSSVTTLSESIDWDVGNLECVEVVQGTMIGISIIPGFYSRLAFKTWTAGASANDPFLQLISSSTTITAQRIWKQKVNGRLYFNYDITIAGEQCIGIWALGKNLDPSIGNSQWAIALDHLYRNDGLSSNDTLNGFYLYQEYMFVSYNDGSAGNAVKLTRTDDQATYSITSIFRTVKFNQILGLRNKHIPDSSVIKKLVGATLTFEPLPSGATASIHEKIENLSSYTKIFDASTVGDIMHAAINHESDGSNLPEHKEIEFKITSTGGAEITSYAFANEITPKKPY